MHIPLNKESCVSLDGCFPLCTFTTPRRCQGAPPCSLSQHNTPLPWLLLFLARRATYLILELWRKAWAHWLQITVNKEHLWCSSGDTISTRQFMMALQSPQLSRPAGMPPVAAALSISFCSTNDLRPSVWHGVLTPKKAILQLQMSLIGCALRRSLKLLQSIRERFPTNWTARKKKNHGNHNALGRLRGFFMIKTFKIRFGGFC